MTSVNNTGGIKKLLSRTWKKRLETERGNPNHVTPFAGRGWLVCEDLDDIAIVFLQEKEVCTCTLEQTEGSVGR